VNKTALRWWNTQGDGLADKDGIDRKKYTLKRSFAYLQAVLSMDGFLFGVHLMLSYDEINNLVMTQLDCLDPKEYEVIPDRRDLFTVFTVKKSGKVIGRYRVAKRPDGEIVYGSVFGDTPEWNVIWDSMLNRAILRAGGRMTDAMEQDFQSRFENYSNQQYKINNNLPQFDANKAELTSNPNELYQLSELSHYKIELLEKTLAGLPMKAEREINFCKFVKLPDYPFGHIRYNVYDSIDNYMGHIYLEKHGENATTMWFQYYMKYDETFKKIQAIWNKYIENDKLLSIIASEGSEESDSEYKREDETSRNVFRQKGDAWEVAFNGNKSFIVKNLMGLGYIHYLLQNPNKPINVKQLQASQSNNTYSVSAKEEEIIDFDMNLDVEKSDADPIFDATYLESIKNELKQLLERRLEAEENLDTEEIERIDLEVAKIEQFVKAGKGLGGKSRSLNNEDDKLRSSVKIAITSAFSHLKKYDPLLVGYLKKTISTGFECEYSPEKGKDIKPNWIL
jgi:hypothetical protein